MAYSGKMLARAIFMLSIAAFSCFADAKADAQSDLAAVCRDVATWYQDPHKGAYEPVMTTGAALCLKALKFQTSPPGAKPVAAYRKKALDELKPAAKASDYKELSDLTDALAGATTEKLNARTKRSAAADATKLIQAMPDPVRNRARNRCDAAATKCPGALYEILRNYRPDLLGLAIQHYVVYVQNEYTIRKHLALSDYLVSGERPAAKAAYDDAELQRTRADRAFQEAKDELKAVLNRPDSLPRLIQDAKGKVATEQARAQEAGQLSSDKRKELDKTTETMKQYKTEADQASRDLVKAQALEATAKAKAEDDCDAMEIIRTFYATNSKDFKTLILK